MRRFLDFWGYRIVSLEALWLFPSDLSSTVVGFLIVCSAMTSMLTATAGVGGGVLLFAIMAWVMPLTALIPVHGVVQIGSNVGRMLLMLQSVRLWVLLPFLAGSILGGALGAAVVVQLPPTVMQIAVGAFILWAAWMKPPSFVVDRRAIGLTGLVVTFLTMFFGATAPLVASVLRLLRLDRLSLVATQSACVIVQHAVKVAAFGFLGFAFAPYLSLVVAMITAGFIGTLIGTHLLRKIADQRFQVILSCVLTMLAVGLLAKGTSAIIISPSVSEASVVRMAADESASDGLPNTEEMKTTGSDEQLSDGLDHAGLWQAANRRLREDLSSTHAALSLAESREYALAEEAMRDRQKMAAMEKEFQAARQQIQELERRMGQLKGTE